jgi:integrase
MKTKIRASEHLEDFEVRKLLRLLQSEEQWHYYVLVRLGISVALRYSDLQNLKWKDIIGRNYLTIQERKTGKVREIPLSSELVQNLTKIYLKIGSPSKEDKIIPITIRGVNKQLKVFASKCGIRGKRISTHSFRKTFGREVWKRNNYSEASIVKLSELFKHSSTSVTRIYLSITKEEINDLYEIQDLFSL